MKFIVRMFFRTLRLALTPFMLLGEKLSTPQGIERSSEAQQKADRECRNLALYQFRSCPFCIKVRKEISRLSLNIELRDAQHDPQHREALLQGGGKIQTPCLKITDEQGNNRWMYESGDIIQYLQQRFS
jgi:glutaredoxin